MVLGGSVLLPPIVRKEDMAQPVPEELLTRYQSVIEVESRRYNREFLAAVYITLAPLEGVLRIFSDPEAVVTVQVSTPLVIAIYCATT